MGVTVTCAGGGGIPVVPTAAAGSAASKPSSTRTSSAALLATRAATPTPCSCSPTSTACTTAGAPRTQRPHPGDLARAALRPLDLPAGSMGPKVDAVCRFVEAGGRWGRSARPSQAARILDGRAGTIVRHHEG